MAIVTTDNRHYSDIANAIREKGINGTLTPAEMSGAIHSISTGSNAVVRNGVEITDWKRISSTIGMVPKSIVCYSDGFISAYQFASYGSTSYCCYYYVEDFTLVTHSPLLFIDACAFANCSWLTDITPFSHIKWCNAGVFQNCTGITGSVEFPELEEINDYSKSEPLTYINRNGGLFSGCTGITSISMPKLKGIYRNFASGCTSLTEVSMPKLQIMGSQNNNQGTFRNCTALQTATFGSIGTCCTVRTGYDFQGCTQSGLTITIYCTGNIADANLAYIRNGATNATVIVNASEPTTYAGISYAAGETMITSNP